MESLSRAGACFRSPLLPADRAEALAAQLGADTRYQDLELRESQRAKAGNPNRFYLTAVPADPGARAAILERQQAARRERAQAEGPAYIWAADPDGAWWHVATGSGAVYEVDQQGRSCSCPDFEDRCAANGIQCKHLIALAAGLGTFHGPDQWDVALPKLVPVAAPLVQLAAPAPEADRRAAIRARRAIDFPDD